MDPERTGTATAVPEVEELEEEEELQPDVSGGHEGIHLPPTSIWPITLAFGITIAASGLVTNWIFGLPGFFFFVWALYGWAQELLHGEH